MSNKIIDIDGYIKAKKVVEGVFLETGGDKFCWKCGDYGVELERVGLDMTVEGWKASEWECRGGCKEEGG